LQVISILLSTVAFVVSRDSGPFSVQYFLET